MTVTSTYERCFAFGYSLSPQYKKAESKIRQEDVCPGSKLKKLFSLLLFFVEIAQNQLIVAKPNPYNTGNLD